jgi:hypothetical protein
MPQEMRQIAQIMRIFASLREILSHPRTLRGQFSAAKLLAGVACAVNPSSLRNHLSQHLRSFATL